ncbi:hypothetical protein GCM10009850_022670 [Nonomuraea monospora]|uniref:Uncharacterized protein n=1 Tax=Nonomuraea monospora TaxID=568818 RepID=A0ABN3CBR7_9ACTN
MPRIGFEWQFQRDELRFLADSKDGWQAEDSLPSKGRVRYWQDPGVAIESDSGDVEIITDSVTTWAALRRQLVFIGELLTLLTGRSHDAAALPPAFLRTGEQEGDATTGPRRSSRARTSGKVQAVRAAEGHLRAHDDVQAADELRFVPDTNVGNIITVALAAPIKRCEFDSAGDPVMRTVYAAGDVLALTAARGNVHGTVQATVDVPLSELPVRLEVFGFDPSGRVMAWLEGRQKTGNLIGLVTLIQYMLWVFAHQNLTSGDGPKAGFALLPRTNLRSVYMNVLTEMERSEFDAMVNALPSGDKDARVCPRPYGLGGRQTYDNPLTLFWWLRSIQAGDPGHGDETLAVHMSGDGPRGIAYDALSPPRGYPAHEPIAGRPAEWFTYSMGQKTTPHGASHVVVEYRETDLFGLKNGMGTYEQFVTAAMNAAHSAGLDMPH